MACEKKLAISEAEESIFRKKSRVLEQEKDDLERSQRLLAFDPHFHFSFLLVSCFSCLAFWFCLSRFNLFYSWIGPFFVGNALVVYLLGGCEGFFKRRTRAVQND